LHIDLGGLLSGQFNGLAEGDWVGTFGGQKLFISYTMGSGGGGGVVLFTAVLEPGSGLLVTAAALLGLKAHSRRRRIGHS
jgi:hypothetical protein